MDDQYMNGHGWLPVNFISGSVLGVAHGPQFADPWHALRTRRSLSEIFRKGHLIRFVFVKGFSRCRGEGWLGGNEGLRAAQGKVA